MSLSHNLIDQSGYIFPDSGDIQWSHLSASICHRYYENYIRRAFLARYTYPVVDNYYHRIFGKNTHSYFLTSNKGDLHIGAGTERIWLVMVFSDGDPNVRILVCHYVVQRGDTLRLYGDGPHGVTLDSSVATVVAVSINVGNLGRLRSQGRTVEFM